MTSEQIVKLIDSISDPHDLCLISIGLFCATRTSETVGLQRKPYCGDKLIIQGTAYQGKLFLGKVKTNASRNAVPISEDIQPIFEAWKQMLPNISVVEAINSQTRAILASRKPIPEEIS